MQILSYTIYVGLTIAVLAATVLLTQAISERNALLCGPVIVISPALWAMIQWRCKISGGYHCGDIFIGGVSWHFWAALGVLIAGLVLIALVRSLIKQTRLLDELGNLLFASRALAGIWAYVLWIALPIPLIHPPSGSGICPNIPLICHDIPLLGLGGAVWWAGPFFAATALEIARSALHTGKDTRAINSKIDANHRCPHQASLLRGHWSRPTESGL